jgi:hypothetical protein
MGILFLSLLSSSSSLLPSLSLMYLFIWIIFPDFVVPPYSPQFIRIFRNYLKNIVMLHYILHKFNVWSSHGSSRVPWNKNTFPSNIYFFKILKYLNSSLPVTEEVRHSVGPFLHVTKENKSSNLISFRIPSQWKAVSLILGTCHENTPLHYGEHKFVSLVITEKLTSKLASIIYFCVKGSMG